MAKKKDNNYMFFCGGNANDVTGSMIYISFEGKQILLEAGMIQKNDYLENYKANNVKYPFKPSEIDYIFVAHTHLDHIGIIPRLIKQGFIGKIIATHETSVIMKSLLLNSAYLVQKEANILSLKYKRNYEPLYTETEVLKTLEHICEYDYVHKKYILDETVSFEWLENSHCIGARQLVLTLTNRLGISKSILYTSDIGSLHTSNHYLKDTEIDGRMFKYVIMESTYGISTRQTKKTRKFDIEHLKTAIDTVLERKGTVLLPCFSFARTQEILTNIYELYHDKDFKYEVVVDSMLSVDICNLYSLLLKDDDLELWEKVRNWDNVKFIKDKEVSLACVKAHTPKIVISSSGFCTNGRILSYLHEYLKDANSMVIFTGFIGTDNSYLSYRIKNYKQNKKINISGEQVLNNADCISLSTFSSHANHNELVEFGSSCNCEKLILVHGENEAKNNLKADLQEAISKKDKSFKVVCSTKDMTLGL